MNHSTRQQHPRSTMPQFLSRAALVGVALLVAASVSRAARADDLNPPAYRNSPNTTLTEWLFPPGFPSFTSVPGGFPLTNFNAGSGNGVPHLQQTPVEGGTEWSLFQPNFIDDLPRKDLRIQVTYTQAGPFGPIITSVEGTDAGQSALSIFQGSFPGFPGPGLSYLGEDYAIFPNPDFEFIKMTVPNGVTIHQVVIDSISQVPEPGTFALLGLGGLMLARRRRRAR